MPGAKHSSLKALSPANYGSVRRKRTQRLRDPSDPSLTCRGESRAQPPLAGADASLRRHLPHPPPWHGHQKFSFAWLWVSLQMDKRPRLCPHQGLVALLLEPSRQSRDRVLLQQVGEMEDLLEMSPLSGTGFMPFVYMQTNRNHLL